MKKWRVGLMTAMILMMMLAFAPAARADSSYTVQPGDNLFRIALRHGLTTAQLAQANGIVNPNHIYVGQVLTIPDGSGAADAPADAPPAAAPAAGSHVVQPGETLFKIAVKYGLSTSTLAQANGISNVNLVYAGQTLTIPGGAAPAASPPLAAPGTSAGVRWIDVNLTTQTLTAYAGDTAVMSTPISSGIWPYLTVTGQFSIITRYESQTMNGYALGYDYYLPNVPYVMYFYGNFALHGTYWHNNFGTPMSHGCVNLPTDKAEWLFNWSSYGTAVNVHY